MTTTVATAPPDTSPHQIVDRFVELMDFSLIPPTVVESGPVQDDVITETTRAIRSYRPGNRSTTTTPCSPSSFRATRS